MWITTELMSFIHSLYVNYHCTITIADQQFNVRSINHSNFIVIIHLKTFSRSKLIFNYHSNEESAEHISLYE